MDKNTKGILVVGIVGIVLVTGYIWIKSEDVIESNNDYEAYVRPELSIDTVGNYSTKSMIDANYTERYQVDKVNDEAWFVALEEKEENKEELEAKHLLYLDSIRLYYKIKNDDDSLNSLKKSQNRNNSKGNQRSKKKKVVQIKTITVNPIPTVKVKRRTNISQIVSDENIEKSSANSGMSLKQNSSEVNAVIHGDQNIKSGGVVKIRITEDCYVNGIKVKRNSYVNGRASFTGERVNIFIQNTTVNGRITVLGMNVFEMDGNKGIYIPGGINQELKDDAVKNISGEAVRAVPISLLGAATNLITSSSKKKIIDPIIVLTDNYKIILKK